MFFAPFYDFPSILVVSEGLDGCWELSWELRRATGVPKKCKKSNFPKKKKYLGQKLIVIDIW